MPRFTVRVVPYWFRPLALPRTVDWSAAYTVTFGASRLRPALWTRTVAGPEAGARKVRKSWSAVVVRSRPGTVTAPAPVDRDEAAAKVPLEPAAMEAWLTDYRAVAELFEQRDHLVTETKVLRQRIEAFEAHVRDAMIAPNDDCATLLAASKILRSWLRPG